ncbi:MAG: hypothetical protein HY080_02475 [Gammaproteobacteria bacterium]|nr:hypothetical protein [Gammaproteobacteria bacterium]
MNINELIDKINRLKDFELESLKPSDDFNELTITLSFSGDEKSKTIIKAENIIDFAFSKQDLVVDRHYYVGEIKLQEISKDNIHAILKKIGYGYIPYENNDSFGIDSFLYLHIEGGCVVDIVAVRLSLITYRGQDIARRLD